MYPLHGGIEIKQTEVLGLRRAGKLGRIGLAKYVRAVVEADYRDIVVVTDKVLPIVYREIALSNVNEILTFIYQKSQKDRPRGGTNNSTRTEPN